MPIDKFSCTNSEARKSIKSEENKINVNFFENGVGNIFCK